jgi:hypothetical protein
MTSIVSNIYQYLMSYIKNTSLSSSSSIVNIIEEGSYSNKIIPHILTPFNVFMKEFDIYTRQQLLQLLTDNKDFRSIRFIIPKYYPHYILCAILLDVLDILSNDLFHVQTKIIFYFEDQQKIFFIQEFKKYLKSNIHIIQKNKVLPIYAKFSESPSYQIEYTMIFDQKFHILFVKELEDNLSIQRIYFSIDL